MSGDKTTNNTVNNYDGLGDFGFFGFLAIVMITCGWSPKCQCTPDAPTHTHSQDSHLKARHDDDPRPTH